MYKLFRYNYYKQYKFFLRINGKNDLPQFTAMLSIAQNVLFNLNALYLIIGSLIFKPIIYLSFKDPNSSLKVIIGLILFLIPFHLVFIYRKRYLKILDEFKNESDLDNKKGNIYMIIYTICSIIFQISGFIVLAYNH